MLTIEEFLFIASIELVCIILTLWILDQIKLRKEEDKNER